MQDAEASAPSAAAPLEATTSRRPAAVASSASSQETSRHIPPRLTIGARTRSSLYRPSYPKRSRSESHTSLIASFARGTTRMTRPRRTCRWTLEPTASCGATPSRCAISQARARNRKGLELSAPTGHRSMTLPDSSESTLPAMNVPISMSSPRPVAPSSGIPATSSPKRTHRVQWMQRVMSVAISGPRSLSSTARLRSLNRETSRP